MRHRTRHPAELAALEALLAIGVDDPLLDVRVCPMLDRNMWSDIPGRARVFAHVFHLPGVICVRSDFDMLPIGHRAGIMAHEFGHLCAEDCGYDPTDQDDADEVARRRLGVRLAYRSPLCLQWIPMGEP